MVDYSLLGPWLVLPHFPCFIYTEAAAKVANERIDVIAGQAIERLVDIKVEGGFQHFQNYTSRISITRTILVLSP